MEGGGASNEPAQHIKSCSSRPVLVLLTFYFVCDLGFLKSKLFAIRTTVRKKNREAIVDSENTNVL